MDLDLKFKDIAEICGHDFDKGDLIMTPEIAQIITKMSSELDSWLCKNYVRAVFDSRLEVSLLDAFSLILTFFQKGKLVLARTKQDVYEEEISKCCLLLTGPLVSKVLDPGWEHRRIRIQFLAFFNGEIGYVLLRNISALLV